MQKSKLVRSMLKYLLILAILAATIIGLFIGKELYIISLDSQPKTPTQTHVPTEQNNPQPPIVLGTADLCVAVYLSQPPKCKTLDGTFIPVPGAAQFILVTPEGK
jgi:hypothetical protein